MINADCCLLALPTDKIPFIFFCASCFSLKIFAVISGDLASFLASDTRLLGVQSAAGVFTRSLVKSTPGTTFAIWLSVLTLLLFVFVELPTSETVSGFFDFSFRHVGR